MRKRKRRRRRRNRRKKRMTKRNKMMIREHTGLSIATTLAGLVIADVNSATAKLLRNRCEFACGDKRNSL